MSKSTKNMKKADLINLVNELNAEIKELKEENHLLAIQQDDEEENVSKTTTAPKKKKLSDMNEFEIAEYIQRKTSRKVF